MAVYSESAPRWKFHELETPIDCGIGRHHHAWWQVKSFSLVIRILVFLPR